MKIVLASKSGVRKQILLKYGINPEVIVSNVDEDQVKESLLAENADPLIVIRPISWINLSHNWSELLILLLIKIS